MAKQDNTSPPPPLVQGSDPPLELNETHKQGLKEGCRLVSSNSKVLAKFGLCSNYSRKLGECSLARARKNFANARMLAFSLKWP